MFATVLLLAAATTFALRAILASHGTPAYLHDWSWPLTDVQLRDSLQSNISAWDLSGVGKANPFPLYHPIFFVWHWLNDLVGALWTLKLTLWVCFFAYAGGVYAAARWWFDVSIFAARVAALAALLSPAIFTKLLAGHIYYLLALSAFIWAVAFLGRASTGHWSYGLGAAAAAALTVLQVQVFAAALIVFLVFALARRPMPPMWAGASSLVVLLSLALPEIVALHSGSADQLAALRANAHWELNNSPPLASAPVAMGYFTGYADKGFSVFSFGAILRALLWSIPVGAALGLIATRERVMVLFAALWLLFAAMTAGLSGPLQALLYAGFDRFEAASIFREFYHFAPLAWTVACVLATVGLDFLAIGPRVVLTMAALVPAFFLWMPHEFAGQLREWPTSPALLRDIAMVQQFPTPWRVLFLPATWPVGPVRWSTGGVDPAAYAVGNHAAANSYTLTSSQQIAFYFQEHADPRAQSWLETLGAGAAIGQPTIVSRFLQINEAPHRWPLGVAPRAVVARSSPRIRVWQTPIAFDTGDLQVVRSASDWSQGPGFILARDAMPQSRTDPDLASAMDRLPPASRFGEVDASRSWVDERLWGWFDPRIAAMGEGVVSWSSTPLALPLGTGENFAARILLLNGQVLVDNKLIAVPRGTISWIMLPPHGHFLSVRAGLAVVGEFVRLQRLAFAQLPHYRPHRLTPLAFDPHTLSARGVVPRGTRWIVLKQGFSNGWRLRLSQGEILRHVGMSGYGNAWEIDGRSDAQAWIDFAPRRVVEAAQRVGVVIWGLGILAFLSTALGKKNRAPHGRPITAARV